jgi:hypothetical protein
MGARTAVGCHFKGRPSLRVKIAVASVILACGAMLPMLSQAGGLVVRVGVGVPVPVVVAPPAPVVEVVPVAPAVGYVWTPGYWAWGAAAYVWRPGRYVLPPYAGAAWVPGLWGVRGGGYVWAGDHWRHR